MKKQILLVLILAIFVGTNQVMAQAVAGSLPRPISCTTGPFNPIAGVPYDYSADVNPLTGNAYWYATTSTSFMAGGVRTAVELASGGAVVANGVNYMTTAAVPANPTTTNITWTSGGLAAATVGAGDPPLLFVVVEYEAQAPDCANNMKVYPIRPINAFTVDIRNIEDATSVPLAYDVTDDQCFPGVQSAQWVPNPAPNGSIDYDFGINYLYFEVIAANFTGSFTPSFRLSGLIGDQTADVDWGVAIGAYGNNIATGVGNGDIPGPAVTTASTNTSAGVSIYVRVTVHNNDTEGLAAVPISLAVDAVNAAGQDDVLHTDCSLNAVFADIATQSLNLRPTVSPVLPGVFIPVQP